MIQIWDKVIILFQETRYFFSIHNLRTSFGINLSLLGLSETVITYVTHPSKKSTSSSMHIYTTEEISWIKRKCLLRKLIGLIKLNLQDCMK